MGVVSPVSTYLLLGFIPEGVVEKSEVLGAVWQGGKNAVIREEPGIGNGTRHDNIWPEISPYQALWRYAIDVRPVYPRGIYSLGLFVT